MSEISDDLPNSRQFFSTSVSIYVEGIFNAIIKAKYEPVGGTEDE